MGEVGFGGGRAYYVECVFGAVVRGRGMGPGTPGFLARLVVEVMAPDVMAGW